MFHSNIYIYIYIIKIYFVSYIMPKFTANNKIYPHTSRMILLPITLRYLYGLTIFPIKS